MSHNLDIVKRGQDVLIQNYGRYPISMARGEGSRVWDADGKEYLDLFAGFGGAILGHCHPALIEAATAQARKLWHVGNQFYSEPQIEVAERLNKFAFQGQAFFCHGGADANEAAVKLARLRGMADGGRRWKTISLQKSFHGRTLAMIAATGNPAVREGFGPVVPGFTQVDPLDLDALERAIDDETACIIMEPLQGEGGVNVYPVGHPQRIRQLCDEHGLALIYDEVWTGCGRTGKWFAHQHFVKTDGNAGAGDSAEGSPHITPDIMTLGKAVGGGLPVGVMFAKPHLAKYMTPGKHGSTLGGNPIAMTVSRTLFDVIERENLTGNAAALGEYAMARLKHEASIRTKVAAVRGRGLFIGIELKEPDKQLVERGFVRGININVTAQKVVRLAPPINITRDDLDRGLDALVAVIAQG